MTRENETMTTTGEENVRTETRAGAPVGELPVEELSRELKRQYSHLLRADVELDWSHEAAQLLAYIRSLTPQAAPTSGDQFEELATAYKLERHERGPALRWFELGSRAAHQAPQAAVPQRVQEAEEGPTVWTGCGECDCSFPCHNGQDKCLRLNAPAHPETPTKDEVRAITPEEWNSIKTRPCDKCKKPLGKNNTGRCYIILTGEKHYHVGCLP